MQTEISSIITYLLTSLCVVWRNFVNFLDLADILLPLVESPKEETVNVSPRSPENSTFTSPPESPDVHYDVDPSDLALASIPG
jgi:hypothetical protein